MRWPLTMEQDSTGQAYFAALAMLCAEWIQEETPLRLPLTQDPKLQAAAAYTRTNHVHGTVADICKAVGISERTLRRRFRSGLGMSWEDYRRRARLLKAAALLSEGQMPIGNVGVEVGFESQSAFSRAFKELAGRSPRDFKTSIA